ncbi:MAG: Ig-like domain-containing protein [Betaproteobacteria bacterium]|nr:Ig-like domain-containing protein [Betaproteobacteria bacterium]
MDTINTTTPPLITNTLSGGTFHFLTIRLEPAESEFFRGFKIDDDIILVFDEKVILGSGDIVISSETDTRHINIEDTSQVSFDTQRIFSSIFARSSEPRTEYLEFGALIINPETDLLPDTAYTIQLNDGALLDTAGNTLAGFNDIVVTAVDSTPNLLRVTPSDGSTDFRVDENLFLSFDETVVAGSGEVVISSDTDTRTIDINDTSQVTFSENGAVIINPQKDLIPNTVYTLQVSDGAVVDIEGNAFTDFNPRTFAPVAGSLPKLEFSNPENGSSEFQVNDNIELRFDEAVKAGIGNIVISSDSDVRTIAINDSSQVSFNSSLRFGTVIIDPTDDLMPDASYAVQIAEGVITDLSGNAYSGFDNGSISTIEIQPFSYFGTIRDGIRSIFKTDENIVLFIDKNVIAGSGDITISNGSDIRNIAINDTSQVTFEATDGFSDGIFVIIDPKEDLIPDTTYTVQLSSSAIIDTKGDIFAGINEALLTTIDPGPIVSPFPPGIFNNFKADDDFVLTFDEPVIAGEGDIVISNGVDVHTITINDTSQVTFLGRSVVIDPNDNLALGQYTGSITSGAITDRVGNTFAGISDASFTVVKEASPLLTGSNPNNGDTDFRIDENIMLHFNEAVVVGSGNILISNGTDTRSIAIDDASQVTFEEFTPVDFLPQIRTGAVIINPTEDLVSGTTYTVDVTPGVITDTDGNPYAGFSDVFFTTIDSLPVATIGVSEADSTIG